MRGGTTGASTIPEQDLPWRKGPGASAEVIPHLVILWSLEEPERVGEAIPIGGPSVVGRSGAKGTDPAPRAGVVQQRPGATVPMHPLESSRISRVQLSIVPRDDGSIEVQNLGKTSLRVDGSPLDSGLVRPGSVLSLKNAMSFMLVVRPRVLPGLRAAGALRFPFGAPDPNGIVGESPAAWKLRDDLAFVGNAPGHVLVRGESGVGKELAARSIHAFSSRHAQKLVARNAATFPEGIVDVELFGNARNYPNPGTPERAGLVGEADKSTLFLDEIGELPPHLQSHLLRVLDTGGEYQRLGESGMRRADLRFVAATNRAVEELKHDFAARFSLRVEIPGLPARREDIPLLVRHLLTKAFTAQPDLGARFAPKGQLRIDPDLVEALVRHGYTHHLRELDRLLWTALGSSHEEFISLTDEVRSCLRLSWHPPPPSTADMPDRAAVEAALAVENGSVTRAAKRLGLKNRFALYRVMKAFGIGAADAPESEEDP